MMVQMQQLTRIEDGLPEVDQWVLVLEDDDANPSDAAFARVMPNTFKHRYQMTPAKLLHVDSIDGFPVWYLCWGGQHPIIHVRNVVAWMNLPIPEKKVNNDADS